MEPDSHERTCDGFCLEYLTMAQWWTEAERKISCLQQINASLEDEVNLLKTKLAKYEEDLPWPVQ